MEKQIKLSFFRRLKMSIFDFEKYNIIACEGLGRAFLYLIKLFFVFSLILSIGAVVKFSQLLDDKLNYMENNIPYFYVENNQFYIDSENDVILENNQYINIKVILTNNESIPNEQVFNYDGILVVLSKNNIFIKKINSTSIFMQSYEQLGKEYQINEINKDKIINLLTGSKKNIIYSNAFGLVFLTSFFTFLCTILIDITGLSLVGLITSKMIKFNLKYSTIYSMTISAFTLSIIINLVYILINIFNEFIIPYFSVMYILIAYIYLIAAMLIIKSELIKQKIKIEIESINKEKNEENKEFETEKEEKNDESKEKNNKNEKEKLKDKVDGKIKNKDNPEPQANIQNK